MKQEMQEVAKEIATRKSEGTRECGLALRRACLPNAPRPLFATPADVITLVSGVQYKVLAHGEGQYNPLPGSGVVMEYNAKSHFGGEFATTRKEPVVVCPGVCCRAAAQGATVAQRGARTHG